MPRVDFLIRHAETDGSQANWVAEQLRRGHFEAEMATIDDFLYLDYPSVGTIVLLSRSARVLDSAVLRLSRSEPLGVRLDDVTVSKHSPIRADVTLDALDHSGAVDLLRAVARKYEPRLSQVQSILLRRAIDQSVEASRTQKRAFLSYRREDRDSFHLGQQLLARLGERRVFWDRASLEAGIDYVTAVERELESCAILLALIGPDWAEARDEGGRRKLEQPHDWVRMEIRSALNRADVPVVPVVLPGASIPDEKQLPRDLAPLARRQVHKLDDRSWHQDFGKLIKLVETRLV